MYTFSLVLPNFGLHINISVKNFDNIVKVKVYFI